MNAWEHVLKARAQNRPLPHEFMNHLFHEFVEQKGDRLYGEDGAVYGGVAFYKDTPVTVISITKGKDMEENIRRNFGSPNPEGYRKALRLMKQAEKFRRPVFLFIDTKGAGCAVEAEERGQGEAIARCLFESASLRVPILSIITGEGGSGGALALASGDEVYMLEHAIYSILSPEGFSSILYKDVKRAKEASDIMKITAKDLYSLRIIEGIIEEGEDLSEHFSEVLLRIEDVLDSFLVKMSQKSIEEMLEARYERFRRFGEVYWKV
jgi:acetyl-CoA carboxylase carboxyl transferase alpha subunit